jgi:hypothetical protein
MRGIGSFMLVVAVAFIITITNQGWIATKTIYAPDVLESRAATHEAILHNKLPEGAESWGSVGANGINIRILTIWVVEITHRLTDVDIHRAYKMVETICLLLGCVLFFYYLRLWFEPEIAAIGLLYMGCVLPLTYLFYYYHPWDRPSLIAWLVALMLMRKNKIILLVPVLIFAMLVKYDIILLPALYFLANIINRQWVKTSLITIGLFVVTWSTFLTLKILIPGGFDQSKFILGQVSHNLSQLANYGLTYPPLLALSLPLILALYGFSKSDAFAKAAVVFCGMQGSIMFVRSNFVEFRSQMPLLILLMPAALTGLIALVAKLRENK